MPRPKQERQVARTPEITYFKPQGVPLIYLDEVTLALEELEAVRLADLEGQTQAEAAEAMGVSRHTFGRVLASARRNIAKALVAGLALRIEGGHWVCDEEAVKSGRPDKPANCRLQNIDQPEPDNYRRKKSTAKPTEHRSAKNKGRL